MACILPGCGAYGFAVEEPADCVSNADCGAAEVCFFAQCVDPGMSVGSVYVDITPPPSQGLLPQLDASSPRDLSAGLEQTLSLRSAVSIAGTIAPGGTLPVPSGTITAKPLRGIALPGVPSFQQDFRTDVSGGDWSVSLLPGNYELSFTPTASETAPPISYSTIIVTTSDSQRFDTSYPDPSRPVRGRILASSTETLPLEDVKVTGMGVGLSGAAVQGTTTFTDVEGNFELFFTEEAVSVEVIVGQGGDNFDVPTATLFPSLTDVGDALDVGDLFLEVGASVSPSAVVRSDNSEPVTDATVRFEGIAGVGTFTAVGSTDSLGRVTVQSLLPGDYTAIVLPRPEDSFAIGSSALCIPDPADASTCPGPLADPVILTVTSKVRVTGRLVDALGQAVSGALMSMSRQHYGVTRTFTTNSRGDGTFDVFVDPDGPPYVLTVEPARQDLLPRHRQLISVADSDFSIEIQLNPVSVVFGDVVSPSGSALPNALVGFYSVEVGTVEQPALLGLGQSDSNGEFVVPLPALP